VRSATNAGLLGAKKKSSPVVFVLIAPSLTSGVGFLNTLSREFFALQIIPYAITDAFFRINKLARSEGDSF
jgi:hypothetical protein